MKINNKAFTLVELIVVITILSVLSTVAFVSLVWYWDDARDATKTSDLANIGRSIWNIALSQQKVLTHKLTDINYAYHPWTLTVKVWELSAWILPGLWDIPVDPYTWNPYIVWVHANTDGTINFWQIWWVLENKKWEVSKLWTNQKFPSSIPVQRVVGNYSKKDIKWLSGLIPRWALEDYQSFQNTSFYQSWAIMYGSSPWRWYDNSYIFAMNNTPVVQIAWYTDENTLLYESFENMWLENSGYTRFLDRTVTSWIYPWWERVYNNEKIYVPTCVSHNISITETYEFNSTYYDQVRTVECDLPNEGVNSETALKLSWLRDWVAWDGQYNYIMMDPTKQYEMSLDVKWSLSDYSWNIPLYFRCYRKNLDDQLNTLWSISFQFPLDANNFQRVTAYVNTPDPSWNGLSININSVWFEGSMSCIFYRSNTAKAWDELYFDNYVVREIN